MRESYERIILKNEKIKDLKDNEKESIRESGRKIEKDLDRTRE